jgi:hypothetical protein
LGSVRTLPPAACAGSKAALLPGKGEPPHWSATATKSLAAGGEKGSGPDGRRSIPGRAAWSGSAASGLQAAVMKKNVH